MPPAKTNFPIRKCYLGNSCKVVAYDGIHKHNIGIYAQPTRKKIILRE
jgi:hypothetical protein